MEILVWSLHYGSWRPTDHQNDYSKLSVGRTGMANRDLLYLLWLMFPATCGDEIFLEDMDAVLTTDDCALFDDIMQHDQLDCTG